MIINGNSLDKKESHFQEKSAHPAKCNSMKINNIVWEAIE
jgi:hypothetical protein